MTLIGIKQTLASLKIDPLGYIELVYFLKSDNRPIAANFECY